MWFHHIATTLSLSSVLYLGESAGECCVILHLSEVTIPPLMIRWFMRDAGCRPLYVLAVEYIFLASYFVIRVIVCPIAVKESVLHPKPYVLLKICLTMMLVAGFLFFWTTAKATIKRTVSLWNGYKQSKSYENGFNTTTGCKGW